MHSKVSVIIPCYNTAAYLAEAMESVLSQTYSNFEIILVDDGSTDNTKEVALSFTDPRIKYVYQENKGLPGARNTGLRHSKGQRIVFLDADDLFSPDKLSLQAKFLDGHPEFGLVAGGFTRIDTGGNVFHVVKGKRFELPTKDLLQENRFIINSVMVRRQFVDAIGGFDESLRGSEEWDFFCRLALAGCRMFKTEDVVCAYRQTPNSLGLDADLQLRERLKVIEKIYDPDHLPEAYRPLKDKVLGSTYLLASFRKFASDMDAEGYRFLARAVEHDRALTHEKAERIVKSFRAWASLHSHARHDRIFRKLLTDPAETLLTAFTGPREARYYLLARPRILDAYKKRKFFSLACILAVVGITHPVYLARDQIRHARKRVCKPKYEM